ncbi:glycoside hydrolase family 55 protein [Hellea sp.]|nr:glycoside hydrolase family 55 protein [Hellea sp.]
MARLICFRIGVLATSLMMFSSCAQAQDNTAAQYHPADLPKILSHDEGQETPFLPDFSYAGYGFGLTSIPSGEGKVISVTDFGAEPDDGIDDSAAILEAMAAARKTTGSVIIRFPAGKFIISEIINIDRGDIVFQGEGRGVAGTTLYFPRPLKMVGDKGKLDELREYLVKYDKRQREPKKNLDVLFSEYSWTGGFIWVGKTGARPAPYLEEFDKPEPALTIGTNGRRGETTLTVDDAADLKAGQRIQLLWYNKQGEDGALISSLYGYTGEDVGSHHWTFPNRPIVRQRTIVKSIDGSVITLADSLLHDVNEDLPADIAGWDALENIGIEGFHFEFPQSPYYGHHNEQGYNAIYMTGAADSWIRDVTFTNADSGILSYDSANLTLRDIKSAGDRPAHYAVHMGNVHNVLAERVQVYNPVIHSFTFNTQSTRCVYKDSEVFSGAVLDQHAGANHQNLFDNVTLHIHPTRKDGKPEYALFNGSGAGYWQPGHGLYNTSWNLNVIIEDGALPSETVYLKATAEGPEARIVGLSGNRKFELDYRPAPYIESMNKTVSQVPSLYTYQLNQRKDP